MDIESGDLFQEERAEKENIKMLILYRSLFILKRKFEKHKTVLSRIYSQFNCNSTGVISIQLKKFREIFSQITSQCNFLVIPYMQYMELLNPELLKEANDVKCFELLLSLEEYLRRNRAKYNQKANSKNSPSGNVNQSKPKEKEGVDLDNDKFNVGALMLAIADFIQSNKQLAVIDINEEFKGEVEALFDIEIFNKLNVIAHTNFKENFNLKIKEALYEEMNVNKMLNYYEELLIEKTKKKENTFFIEKMISELNNKQKSIDTSIQKIRDDYKASMNKDNEESIGLSTTPQLNPNDFAIKADITKKDIQPTHPFNVSTSKRLINTSKIISKSTLSKKERRKASLTEIYLFYSKQHSFAGPSPTFARLSSSENQLLLSDFLKFCLDFKILVKKNNLIELFKKTAFNLRHLTKDEFFIAIKKIAQAVKEEKKSSISERISLLLMEKREIEMTRNGGEQSSAQSLPLIFKSKISDVVKKKERKMTKKIKLFPGLKQDSDEVDQISELWEAYEKLRNESALELIEKLYEYIEIDNEELYRKKMIGFDDALHNRNKLGLPKMNSVLYRRIEVINSQRSLQRNKEVMKGSEREAHSNSSLKFQCGSKLNFCEIQKRYASRERGDVNSLIINKSEQKLTNAIESYI